MYSIRISCLHALIAGGTQSTEQSGSEAWKHCSCFPWYDNEAGRNVFTDAVLRASG